MGQQPAFLKHVPSNNRNLLTLPSVVVRERRIAMRTHQSDISRAFPLLLLLIGFVAECQAQDSGRIREIGRTTEKEIKVVLSSSFGNVSIARGESGKIVSVESQGSADDPPRIAIDYTVRNRVGYLEIGLGQDEDEKGGKKGGFNIGNLSRGSWDLHFSDAIPISFDVELGVGRGTFDMTGLQVKDFNLSTGASEVDMSFDQENALEIENMNIESGMSRFDGHNLLNANFKHFRFQGGVGSYTLDFGGSLKNEVEVDVEVGLGFVTLVVPKDIGARIIYVKNWASRLDFDSDFENTAENEYLSENFYHVPGKMNISLDSGLGSVKIRHR
jgi:hypothetical protein